MGGAASAASRAASGEQRPLLELDIDGGLATLRTRYDPRLVEQLKRLPGRRFNRERGEWTLPARREALAALARLLASLERDEAQLSERARRRLERHGPGLVELRDGELELSAAPHPQRLARIRALPERRYLAEQRGWRVPPTRAGALALRALVDDGELVATPRAAARLRQLAAPTAADGDRQADRGEGTASVRGSPSPHWRHVTRRPIFRANAARQEWVEGVGWCVRVRVEPKRRGEGDRR